MYWLVRDGKERLATLSAAPGTAVYGEDIAKIDGNEYRVWDPFRSKLAAAVLKGVSRVPIKARAKVLYLGAASGTTASHVSDIVSENGRVYCIEFSQRSFRDLVTNACQNRRNMTPILQDARFPSRYRSIVQEVDTIYSDIAQPDQARILSENIAMYLRDHGDFMMAVKARSVDVSKAPPLIFEQERQVLESRGLRIAEMIRLDPFEKDHCMILGSR
ncbi:MAG TPA: fibrillarin-like rRNA/tRNA 2'-O-methyltransferase [Candidatus Dormibacteraeota bacterium]|jgi:fibrillarin-like pre-rRNA processing protein|nr:fibrillarin-like rRNA/tRNA 2'-O-methyltransferase [Candidatus Dormibacteraeota bacterium]